MAVGSPLRMDDLLSKMSSREEPEKQSRKKRCKRMAEDDGDGEKGDEASVDEEGVDTEVKTEEESGRQKEQRARQ
ncbi:hypothetical protein CPB83DRAFT_895923 [Crepidotus variabilis]|uniref:Uncharacterized protein n=1 Tax=Crepidotus variabilis TaxID=179855 RepID=A0A9P6EDF1_9AGAR|nr:hypothetical protein CPB83DRAFT_895923 [Crepidotus variabilis]